MAAKSHPCIFLKVYGFDISQTQIAEAKDAARTGAINNVEFWYDDKKNHCLSVAIFAAVAVMLFLPFAAAVD